MRLVLSLWRVWLMRRPLAEGRLCTERVLGIPGVSDLPDFGWLLGISSEFPRFQGDHERARTLAENAVAVIRARGEKLRLAVAIENLASIVANQGEYQDARVLHEESLALGRELESPYRIAHALNGLTVLAFRERDFFRMRDLANDQLAISRGKNDDRYSAAALHNLAESQRYLGELGPAALIYEEALTFSLRIGDANLVAEMPRWDRRRCGGDPRVPERRPAVGVRPAHSRGGRRASVGCRRSATGDRAGSRRARPLGVRGGVGTRCRDEPRGGRRERPADRRARSAARWRAP